MKNQISQFIIFAFLLNSFGPLPMVQAQEFVLPKPGTLVRLSPSFNPPMLKGIKVHPDNPFKFDFLLDKGESSFSNELLKQESARLIKYFLASITIPEKDLWVNLSPYEKERIVPESFGLTEMGRDMLAQDYMLKQITSSLIYPEDEIGKQFWKRVYEEAAKQMKTTNIPVNTFNKVWIVPEKAIVYENAKLATAYVVRSELKVMLESDYLALTKNQTKTKIDLIQTNEIGKQIVREIVIPLLTKEVNQGKNFTQLRQVYNSLILATWYKKKIKDSILSLVYEDKNKVTGVNIDDPQEKQKIYERYLQAFKKGVYNYIKEEVDPVTQTTVPRKYFAGGENFIEIADKALIVNENDPNIPPVIRDEIEKSLKQDGLGENIVRVDALLHFGNPLNPSGVPIDLTRPQNVHQAHGVNFAVRQLIDNVKGAFNLSSSPVWNDINGIADVLGSRLGRTQCFF